MDGSSMPGFVGLGKYIPVPEPIKTKIRYQGENVLFTVSMPDLCVAVSLFLG